ncbi:MAG: ABC transporter ATP-binding protein [Candidatus Latescibacteria bacterium]|jgi:putative ABC transport system ATP-binding protein|nr:ABC transporter ATP-binding protein [Candidatus Latescibacterota bacterium]
MAFIETTDLCKFYNRNDPDEVRAIRDISLRVEKGSTTIIRGPSGSGKTTLISQIGAIDRPTSGEVYVDGNQLNRMSESALSRIRRDMIGFVFQSFNLIGRLPAWENVSYPLIPTGLDDSKRLQKALEVMESLGLGDRLHHLPEELSGGQQQRVAIARALVNSPELIIADEPSASIDKKSVENLIRLFVDFRDEGRTLVISTHDPLLYPLADQIVELDEGRIVNILKGESGGVSKQAEAV